MRTERKPDSHRLPRTVVPERYDIQIEPDLALGAFAGEETIEVTVREPVTEVVLNVADLWIQEVTIQSAGGKTFEGIVALDHGAERARLLFQDTLTPGPWRLSLKFNGSLSDKLRGFYRSTVKRSPASDSAATGSGAADTGAGALAVTQFEATDARRAFPCWDEPDCKAVFQTTLIVEEGLTALSNTRVLSEDRIPGTGKKAVRFAPTIKMPTYLVAFIVGQLESTQERRVGETPIRIWCVPGKIQLATFALEVAAFSLGFFQDYYGMPYPGDKLDLIAIPDFAFGAMENLGAITFRETALLVDERTATLAEQERVADVVAHEIAHMWFGDLVTMRWWNGLWLNEAFATFMEMLAVDAWRPEWDRWVSFGVSRAAALQVDGLASSRPIEFEVTAPKDAEAMFDVLTYEKGGAVLRMLEQYLGPAVFRDGVRRYLADHQFGNAETSDLWRALGEAAGQPIPEVMDGWIFRPGYPMLTVRADNGGPTLCFSQRRFTYLPGEPNGPALWQVPINLRVRTRDGATSRRLLLSAPEQRVELPAPAEAVVANEGGHGFYRVRYGPDLLERLLESPLDLLAPIERFNLVSDAWASTLAGLDPIGAYLDLTARFQEEADRNVWTALLSSFAFLHRVVPPGDRPALEVLVRNRLGPVVARMGWVPVPGESDLQRQLRGEVLRGMGTLGSDAAVQAEARNLYARQREDASAADPNVVAALISILAHAGGVAEYAEFLGRFQTGRTPQEEQRYLYALAGFRQPGILRRTLDLTLSGEVRTQDAPYLVRGLLTNVYGRELAWAFVKEHWDAMERQYPQGAFRKMCEGITALATPELEASVREFFRAKKISLGGKTQEQYLEQLRIAVAFREREAGNLAAYLSRYVGQG